MTRIVTIGRPIEDWQATGRRDGHRALHGRFVDAEGHPWEIIGQFAANGMHQVVAFTSCLACGKEAWSEWTGRRALCVCGAVLELSKELKQLLAEREHRITMNAAGIRAAHGGCGSFFPI